ncbi:hypothetical protein [Roseomonas sp. WA12]
MPDNGDDDTVLLTPHTKLAPVQAPVTGRVGARGGWLLAGAAATVLGLGAAYCGMLQGPGQAVSPGVPVAAQAPPAAPAAPAIPLMTREALLAWQPAEATLLRLADRPAVFVIAFPSLAQQGRMMNRLAAFIEKAKTPRDRLLDDAALAAAIAEEGMQPETYYYGHDYSLADVERFFALARRSGVVLNAEERWLEARLPAIGSGPGGEPRAIITLPAESSGFDASARRAVLDHEAGHGLYFTDLAFAAQVLRAWREVFTEADREAFRRFLKGEGYDASQEWLMANEAMAYLVFTPDARFFDPARDLGLDAAATERLRAAMRPPAH